MSKINIATLLFLLLPILTWAQSDESAPKTLTVGDKEVVYTEEVKTDAATLYYDKSTEEEGAVMIASTHDTNGDDIVDTWFIYNTNQNVTTEAYDQNNDGLSDVVLTVDENGEVISMTGDGANKYIRDTATVPFNPEPISDISQDEDLVGNVDDITIKPKDNNWMFFVILLVVGVGLYFFWKRQK